MADPRLDAPPPKGDVRAFIQHALKRWKLCSDAESNLRKEMLLDKKFMASDQWDDAIRRDREAANLPVLTINKLTQPKRQILHAQRAGRPAIQINPVDSGADPKTAEALQGLIRNIERQSQSDVVYATAGDDQVTCGRGYWRVLTEYVSEDLRDDSDPLTMFQQQIRLKRIRNAFTVYFDPSCQEVDYRDARFAFVIEDVPKDEYLERYPDSEAISISMGELDPVQREWCGQQMVRIAEYWYVEVEKAQKCLVEVPALEPDGQPQRIVYVKRRGAKLPEGYKLIQERETSVRRVKWCVINAVEILDGNEDLTAGRNWHDSKFIPIVPVLGDEIDIEGKVDLRGMARDARDQNRRYNYLASVQMEMLGLASKAPWLVFEGQIEGYENQWATANTVRHPYLTVKPLTIGGQSAGYPQRNTYEPAIQALVVSLNQANEDLQSQTGFYDPSLGKAGGPDESGRAILARQRQGEMGSSNYMDGLSRAIRYTGEILIDLIPKIYDAPRVERILGSDNQERSVVLHAGAPPGAVAAMQQHGIAGIYDVSVGRYDVTVSVGPTFESRRQESVEMMMSAMERNPQLWQLIGDLAFKNVDTPGALEISERLKKMLPPQLQDEGEGQADPAMLQQQLAQAQQQYEQLGQAFQQLQGLVATKAQELAAQGQQRQMELQAQQAMKQAEIDSRERIAVLQAQTELQRVQVQAQNEERMAKLEALMSEMAAERDFRRSMASKGVDMAGQMMADRERADRDDERSEAEHGRALELSIAKASSENGDGARE